MNKVIFWFSLLMLTVVGSIGIYDRVKDPKGFSNPTFKTNGSYGYITPDFLETLLFAKTNVREETLI